MVKYSQYNVRIPMSANTDVLYNTASDKFIAIRRNAELKDISELSESLTQLLLDNQMIVPEELDERGEVIAQWEKSVKSETDFFGTITIAGQNINDYNLKWWRQHCGVVMQDGVIFSESIGRNIAVGDGDVDVGRLEQAARIANIHCNRPRQSSRDGRPCIAHSSSRRLLQPCSQSARTGYLRECEALPQLSPERGLSGRGIKGDG